MPITIPAARDGHTPSIIGLPMIRPTNTETRTDAIIAPGIPPLMVSGRDDTPIFATATLPNVEGKIMRPIHMDTIGGHHTYYLLWFSS